MYGNINIILGKCNSGKSYLLKYLVYEIFNSEDIEICLLFSRSANTAQYSFIPTKWQHNQFDNDLLQKIHDTQQSLAANSYKPPRMLLIFDDMIDKLNQSACFKTICNNCRHLNIMIIYSLQFLSSNISTNFREITDKAFIFAQNRDQSQTTIWKEFLPFITKDEYRDLNYDLAQYEFIHIDTVKAEYRRCIAPGKLPNFRIQHVTSVNPIRCDRQ